MTETTQGYITLGVDAPGKTTYIRAAYALSMSLKLTDPDRQTAVVVRKFGDVPSKYEKAFDFIIELPFARTDKTESNVMIDMWQLSHCTPFNETIFVHPMSLAIDNIDSLWDLTRDNDLVFGAAQNVNQEFRSYENKFVAQTNNNIRAFNIDVFYFKQSIKASEFFKMADVVFKNWRTLLLQYVTESRPTHFDYTLIANLTMKLLGEDYICDKLVYTDFVADNLPIESDDSDSWLDQVDIWFIGGTNIKINNHRQTGLFVYHNMEILNSEALDDIRSNYTDNTTKIKT